MKTSDNITNLTKSLLMAQKQMGAAVKGSKNPYFKSSYADLPTVMEVVKNPLNDVGVLVLQPSLHREGRNFIQTALVHAESGEMLVSETEVICAKQNDPQAFGAAQTYARRFGLQSMLFIPAEDDDGNRASGRETPKVAVPKTLPTPVTTEPSLGAGGVISNTAITATLPLGSVQTVTEVQPLKTSSFRKNKKPAAEVSPVVETSEGDWN